ncbi:hypothetical protein BGW39_000779 [Mortierella sp. 14UC]|nr:hypothetical protein BGW39_000779 [Mortierella sp. 14UC]
MSTEPQPQPRTPVATPEHDQIDKRVPPEIWERIFHYLYPSQLTRMSMVNINFNKIVSSLSVWSYMFSVAFGSQRRLRTLRNMPESKSYMLYMCASSLYVCEKCLSRTAFGNIYQTPKPILAPMPTSSKGNLEYMGEQVNLSWTIWMCPSCREKQVSELEVGNDKKTMDRILWYRRQD